MHRKKNEANLLSLDLKIERTLTRLRKLKITEQEGMAEQNTWKITLKRQLQIGPMQGKGL